MKRIGMIDNFRHFKNHCEEFPLTSYLILQFLAFCAPNYIIQILLRHPKPLPLILAQTLNCIIIFCISMLMVKINSSKLIILITFVISCYLCNFLWTFGSLPSAGAYYALLNTDHREFIEYLTIKYITIFTILFLALTYYQFYRMAVVPFQRYLNKVRTKTTIFISLIVVSISSGGLLAQHYLHQPEAVDGPFEECLQSSFPIGFILSVWNSSVYIVNHRPNGTIRALHAVRPLPVEDREVVVLVIGESASSNYWSLNGFPYPTNARIKAFQDAGELVYFPHTYAQANLTQFAVPMIVTAAIPSTFSAGQKGPSLLTAFKEIGFATDWLSNQERIQYPGDADKCLIVSSYTFPGRPSGPSYDEALLPFLDQELASPKKKIFIAMHLMGSHATYGMRVPPNFATPGLGNNNFQDRYTRTICYTDYILDATIRRLAQSHGRCLLWYVSDHGELPQPWDVGHGLAEPVVGEVQIPMLAWGNRAFWSASAPAYQRLLEHREERVSQGVTFPTLLSLAGITYPQMDHTRDLTSEAYLPPTTFQVIAPDGKVRNLK